VIKAKYGTTLPSNWKWYKARECMDVRDGTHDSPQYISEGYPLVTSKNLSDGKIDFSTCSYISKEDHEAISKRSAVDDGDILYAMIGTIGNPVIVEKSHEFSIKNVALFKFNNKNVFNKYIYYFLNSEIAKRQFDSNSRGGTQKFVSLTNIRDLQVPLPPLETQKQIAQVLETADQLRKDCQQVEQELNALAQSVFLEMFGDPSINPKNFPLGTIKNLVEEVKYGTSEKADETIGDFPMLRMNNITYTGEWNFSSLKYANLDKKDHEKYLTKKGDILFNRTNSRDLVGKTAVFREDTPMAIAGYLIRVRVNNKANSEYISAYLNSIHGKQTLQHMCKSIVGMANINAQELQKIKILMPPKQLQDEFDNKLTKIRAQRKINTTQFTEYNNLFNALLQKAFKGELDLKSTEQA